MRKTLHMYADQQNIFFSLYFNNCNYSDKLSGGSRLIPSQIMTTLFYRMPQELQYVAYVGQQTWLRWKTFRWMNEYTIWVIAKLDPCCKRISSYVSFCTKRGELISFNLLVGFFWITSVTLLLMQFGTKSVKNKLMSSANSTSNVDFQT